MAKQSVSCDKPLTKTITKKIITTDEINSKETKLTTAKQTILRKKSAKKSSPQKNNPKNRYPKQPAAPDFSITVIKEEHDVKCGLRGVNSEICPTDESVTSVVLSDPLASDAPVALIVPDAPIDPVPPIAQVVLTDPVPMIVSVAPIVPVDPIVSVAPTIPVYKKNPNALLDTITCELTPDVLSPLDDLPAHLEDLLISDDDSDKNDICLRYMESDDSDDEFEGRRRDRDGGHRGGRGDGLDDSDEGTYSPMMRLPFIKDMMTDSPIPRQAMIARPGSPG